jgi:hypothetical protein
MLGRRLLNLFLAVWIAASLQLNVVQAAEIVTTPDSTADLGVISITGKLLPGDEKKFIALALDMERAAIVLHSDGGDLHAGLGIGKAIRLKEFVTWVGENGQCASACALAWLAGEKRLAHRTARIGFHAAYFADTGDVTGSGNALVGAYLYQLGLPQSAIIYVTEAAPREMQWLPLEKAESIGIDLQITDDETRTATDDTRNLPGNGTIKRVNGFDLFGYDLANMPIKNIDADACEASCESNSACRAYTFNRPNRACFLKAGGSLMIGNPNAVAGYKPEIERLLRQSSITVYEKTDLPGMDYRDVQGTTLANCIDECEDDKRCAAFTYNNRHKLCWLKSSVPLPVKTRRAISGLKQLSQ